MIQDLQVRHYEYTTARSFEDVVAAFEGAVGTVENAGWEAIRAGSRNADQFEARVLERIGDSSFTRFLTIDHGSWLTLLGQPTKMRMYTIGNPLIAMTMLRHNIAASLNVPVRLVIYRDEAADVTRLAYDKPSSLMSGLHNPNLAAAAEKLDAKLAALAERVVGAKAD
jgi:uncharacterized protein (DUF302 family)